MKLKILTILLLGLVVCAKLFSQDTLDYNTQLMQCTYQIVNEKDGEKVCGTCFLIAKDRQSKAILVTAKHVLDRISEVSDSATIYLRNFVNDEYIKTPYTFPIRNNKGKMYTSSPSADIAVMYIDLPLRVRVPVFVLPIMDYEKHLQALDFHPGDEVMILGYPKCQESDNISGFPILRSGRVASYPIFPVIKHKTFLVDFEVYPGNSGGPVYFYQSNRVLNGVLDYQVIHTVFIGIVSAERVCKDKNNNITDKLAIGCVIHAKYLLEAINILPSYSN